MKSIRKSLILLGLTILTLSGTAHGPARAEATSEPSYYWARLDWTGWCFDFCGWFAPDPAVPDCRCLIVFCRDDDDDGECD